MDRREALRLSTILLGGTVSAATLSGVLQGCKADPRPDWLPAYIPEANHASLAELCETIIPTGKTPGAKDAKVDRFIDAMLKDVWSTEDAEKFKNGLIQLDKDANTKFGKSFAKISPAQRIEMVKVMDDELKNQSGNDKSFYGMAKELTITGYCTSEEGATKLLKYLPVPGEYKPCIPLSEVGGAWAI